MQARLDHQINLTGRQQGIGIAIAAIAGELHLASATRRKAAPSSARADFGKCGEKAGLFEARRGSGLQARFSPKGPLIMRTACSAHEALARVRLIDEAQLGPLVAANRNQHAPGGRPTDVSARAVDGIKHPGQSGCSGFGSKFLAQNSIVGPFLAQNGPHRLLGIPVGHRVTGSKVGVPCFRPSDRFGGKWRSVSIRAASARRSATGQSVEISVLVVCTCHLVLPAFRA